MALDCTASVVLGQIMSESRLVNLASVWRLAIGVSYSRPARSPARAGMFSGEARRNDQAFTNKIMNRGSPELNKPPRSRCAGCSGRYGHWFPP